VSDHLLITPGINLERRIFALRWAVPLALAAVATLVQLGPARFVHDRFGDGAHYLAEIVFYGTTGPLLAYWTLTRVEGWAREKRLAEHRAESSQRRLAFITSASADAILGLDASGAIESWNRGAELTLGYPAESMVGKPLTALFGDTEAAAIEQRWLTETVRREGFVTGHETTCRRADGRSVSVELTATNLPGDLASSGMSLILRDVTERRRREDEIRRLNASLKDQVAERTRELAEKVDALKRANDELQQLDRLRSEFVALVSHQIRAPLTNMRGAIEELQRFSETLNGTSRRMLVVLNEQVERLDRLVRDVLNAARIESGQLTLHTEPVSLLPIAATAVDQFRARNSGRRFVVPLKPGLPPVLADRDRVADVLGNLLDNADKYSPPETSVVLRLQADQQWVTLSVDDDGPGVPAADLERIFEKHYRVDSSDSQSAYGYGLGLYVCRRLVEAQGGRIWAENLPRGGARFSFTLPVAP
jgi:PAS domain S-box-containing protein